MEILHQFNHKNIMANLPKNSWKSLKVHCFRFFRRQNQTPRLGQGANWQWV